MIKETDFHKRLTDVLNYDPVSGLFKWKLWKGGTANKDTIAGSINCVGYRQLNLDGVMYLEHRLAWFYMNKCWPTDQIDHLNRVRSDNSWSNLRDVSQSVNNLNCQLRKDNTTGHKCVYKHGPGWRVKIKFLNKVHCIGTYKTIDEAVIARDKALLTIHGEVL